ncbi:LysR family transcriptional regulator [Bordetella sp. BOR01]|uniref:LysR family transcriptional regulator n=1 Tax=Bordetella sp. BOR01 TaxID=2854779 RepID=UPI001C490DAB|nr:LysR family transcriptional regulator [Bordetella sp. BOR01]MBV7483380.1 LysR family transcriptional regulator [Bordetella sp. BOR01]
MTTFGEKNNAKLNRLWAMQVFVRVAESGGFARAAASLDLANPTVTACVRKLEKHLGVTLINRNTRFISLTDPGKRFLQHCKDILEAVDLAEADVETRLKELRGTLTVEMPIAIGQALICPALSDFAARNPRLSVAVTLTNQPRNVIQCGIDAAIRMDEISEIDLVARPLCQARFVLCGTPALVDSLPKHPAKLDPQVCLGLLREGQRTPVPWELQRGTARVDVRPQGPLHFNSSEALIGAALSGTGLVRVADLFATTHMLAGDLVPYCPDWSAGLQSFYVVTPRTRAMPGKVRAFIDFLLDTLQARPRPRAWQHIRVRSASRAG